ncbi:MAG TPA: hypothetical protein VGL65_05165, partial [Gemmatimonadales bacterium]
MKRFPLMVASGAIGLALLAGVTHKLTASTSVAAQVPGDGVGCYYHLWTCSYDGNGYWDGCDSSYGEGWVPTS